jgi:hypothetical protein
MQPSPHLHQSSKTKPLTNPTTTRATVYQYTAIALAVLIHILDDHPRHVRYREMQRSNVGLDRERREGIDRSGMGRGRRARTGLAGNNDRSQATCTTSSSSRRGRTSPSPTPRNDRAQAAYTSSSNRTRGRTSSPAPNKYLFKAQHASSSSRTRGRPIFSSPPPPPFQTRRPTTPDSRAAYLPPTPRQKAQAWTRMRSVTPSTYHLF